MVEALGTAPKSSMCVESYQRLRLIYNTSSHLCQGILHKSFTKHRQENIARHIRLVMHTPRFPKVVSCRKHPHS